MTRFKLLAFPLLCVALAACANDPPGQGGKPRVLFAAGDTIRLQWDPQLTSEAKVRSLARAFCGGREVLELDSPHDVGAPGGLRTKTWRCEIFPGSGSGM